MVSMSHFISEFESECWVNITKKTDTSTNKTFSWNAQTNNTQAESDAPQLNALTMANLSVMSVAYASIRK